MKKNAKLDLPKQQSTFQESEHSIEKQKTVRVGLIGCGTVGSGVAEILLHRKERLEKRLGFPIELHRVFDRNRNRIQKCGVPPKAIASNWQEIVEDPEIDLVVELIGGTTEAKDIILESIGRQKAVVTANKALLADFGKEIFEAARKNNVDLAFEAAVGGGIPILRALREGFAANEIASIQAIINGTCNYILSQMTEEETSFEETLKHAQELGYAEKDPTLDIGGFDAAHKLAILIAIAHGVWIPQPSIAIEGIADITALDIAFAAEFGFAVKLLAIAEKHGETFSARVHPCLIEETHPLTKIREAFNAILIEGDYVGPAMLSGKGAGRDATASAVVGDLIELARNLRHRAIATVPPLGYAASNLKTAKILPMKALESEYYLRLKVTDKPGVLSKLTGILGKHKISLASVYQHGQEEGQEVPLVFFTHTSKEEQMLKALNEIHRSPFVHGKALLLRIVSHGG